MLVTEHRQCKWSIMPLLPQPTSVHITFTSHLHILGDDASGANCDHLEIAITIDRLAKDFCRRIRNGPPVQLLLEHPSCRASPPAPP